MKLSDTAWLALLSFPSATLACDAQSDDHGSKNDSIRLEGTEDPQGNGPENLAYYSLVDRDFLLDHVLGYEPVEGVVVGMSFFTIDQVKFISGCNLHYADYQVEGNRLIISNIGHYAVGCEPRVLAQEAWFREFLKSERKV